MIIGIVNNKGGVLKTTLSTNLGACLSLDNKKVIIVDLDGQGNVIATFGKSPYSLEYTMMDFLRGDCNLKQCIIRQRENLHILPGNDDLNFFDYYVNSNQISQSHLKITLKKLNEVYDYVIIDTPPTMSTIVAIVLSICDVSIIPFEPDQYAILGLRRIIDAANDFINKSNKKMKIIAVPTKVNTRVTIHNEIINLNIRPKLFKQNIYVTKNFVSASTKSTASVGYEKVPIVFSVVKSKYQDEYKMIKDEIIEYLNNVHKPTDSIEYNEQERKDDVVEIKHYTETKKQPEITSSKSTFNSNEEKPNNLNINIIPKVEEINVSINTDEIKSINKEIDNTNESKIEEVENNLEKPVTKNKPLNLIDDIKNNLIDSTVKEMQKSNNFYGKVIDYKSFLKNNSNEEQEE